MKDYILFMHDDATEPALAASGDAWEQYFAMLGASGHFGGGSSIGPGVCVRRGGEAPAITPRLTGFVRVQAESLEAATRFVSGNPVYEAGGTVEVRELPRD